MPVMVVGAESALGEAVVRGLLRTGGQVRVYVDPDDDDVVERFRGMGCKVARGEVDDTGRLEIALTQVHTVICAGDSLLDQPDEVLDALASVAEAAVGANVRRLVWPSWLPGQDGGGAWLRMCAQAEELVHGLPCDTVIVRRALTFGPGDAFTVALASDRAARELSSRHQPVWLQDVADTLVAADAQRGGSVDAASLTVELAGPAPLPLAQAAERLHARLGALDGIALPAHTLEYLAHDRLPGSGALGQSGTPFTTALPLLDQ